MCMFIKIKTEDTAKILQSAGFQCVTEVINGQTYYCFEQSPELAKIILTKFSDEILICESRLNF